jgi:hypothetical protein
MPYSAITYRVKPGHEDEIAALFAGFRRVESPVLRNEDGEDSGRLLGTAVFIKDDLMVRVIHYEGSLADVARHIAVQPGVQELERRLAPYLADVRRTGTPREFAKYFHNATMRCLAQLSVDTHPTVR